jgi:ribosome biogenesis protein ERB1
VATLNIVGLSHRDFIPLVHLNSFVRDTRAVLLHQLTKKHSHHPFRKLPGLPVAATFHPSQKMFFVATKKFVRVYDLQKAQLVKKLESGLREISSISIHPGGRSQVSLIVILRILKSSKESLRTDVITSHFLCAGDNVIVGSKDGKLCWFDTDLSTRPYKTLKYVVFSYFTPL